MKSKWNQSHACRSAKVTKMEQKRYRPDTDDHGLGNCNTVWRSIPLHRRSWQERQTSIYPVRHGHALPDLSVAYLSFVAFVEGRSVVRKYRQTKFWRGTCFMAYIWPVGRSFTSDTTPKAPKKIGVEINLLRWNPNRENKQTVSNSFKLDEGTRVDFASAFTQVVGFVLSPSGA